VLLNRLEFVLMNNPVRAAIQRHVEARRLLRLGGPIMGGAALELGCGRGVGAAIILDVFGASSVDAFDLDPRMVARARRRLDPRADVRLWVGDATAIPCPDARYEAVFDFGILHHVPDWRAALREVRRILKPGGRFYAEEVLAAYLRNPLLARLFRHPTHDRFDAEQFVAAVREAGLTPTGEETLGNAFAWFVARREAA